LEGEPGEENAGAIPVGLYIIGRYGYGSTYSLIHIYQTFNILWVGNRGACTWMRNVLISDEIKTIVIRLAGTKRCFEQSR
jgi:hypothetical protein